jgi:tRNA A37 methylthiotransferase MiaB
VTAFVTIMEGCDKACTYCIVPTTRGREISRPAPEIIQEINKLAGAGYRDITLLGQNVNSYGKRFPDGSGYRGPLGRLRLLEEDPDSLLDFPALLRMIDASLRDASGSRRDGTPDLPPAEVGVPIRPDARFTPAWLRSLGARGSLLPRFARETVPARPSRRRPHGTPPRWRDRKDSEPLARRTLGRSAVRIRFTTSHPFDATERLFEAMRDCPSLCEALHLPVQSGSTRMLRAMRRGYTREAYLGKIEALRRLIPDISLSTDIIVGFPGETDDEFQHTVSLLREVEYDNAYIFKYSPRPGTDAAAREDDVPQEVKEARNQALLAVQDDASLKRHQQFEERTVEVLIEGPGKHPGQLFGRTRGNHGVILDGPPELVGQLVDVTITRATAHTLFGEAVEVHGPRSTVHSQGNAAVDCRPSTADCT